MPLTEDEARALLERTLALSQADEAEVVLSSGAQGHLRFARNTPTTAGQSDETHVRIRCAFGKHVGRVSTTDLSDAGLESAMRRAEDAARAAPESPEQMPCLGPQDYALSPEWDDVTAQGSAQDRAEIVGATLTAARKEGVTVAGFWEDGSSLSARANTRGLFAAHRRTHASYSLTARTGDGDGSGWAAADSFQAAGVDGRQATDIAIRKALASRMPITLEPGAYPAVLEPSPAADMVGGLLNHLDRRSADEGRSFFTDKDAGTKLGQRIFGSNVEISSDPANPIVPATPWGEDGLPLASTVWVRDGVLENLAVSRYWAEQKHLVPLPFPSNVMMRGEEHTLDDLVAATDYGLLITSFWYIRSLEPQTILNTGLTRDGLFLIERGQITRPVVNFRWNESPAALLGCVEMMSRPERAVGRQTGWPALVPALKVRAFHFSSVSPST